MQQSVGNILGFIGVLLLFTMFISFAHAIGNNHPCSTIGRYLPATYLFCKLSEPL